MTLRPTLPRLAAFVGAAAISLAATFAASAAEVTLRMHHFLPPQSTVPAHILTPWAERVEAASGGRIDVEIYPAMTLGGTPPSLIDQARDGVVDIIWTLPGYTPGRFPRTEVFELPFMVKDAASASRAFWTVFEEEMAETEFADWKILGTWVHGPGVLHTKGEPVRVIGDMKGRKLRGPTRTVNALLEKVGAIGVGMPVPALPENLQKGVVDGAVIPWEVTTALKIAELVDSHTEFGGERAFYTATFVLAMNKARYEGLPDDLRAVIDAESGAAFSESAGEIQQSYDAAARQIAVDAGNEIALVEGEALDAFVTTSASVTDDWIAEMDAKGIDGKALVERVRALIDEAN